MAHDIRHSRSALRLNASRSRPSTPRTGLYLGLVAVILLQIASSSARAVLIDSADGTGNISAPANDPGFAHLAVVNHQSAVYLENGWLLTAYHVGIGEIELNGTLYDFVVDSRRRIQGSGVNPPDLALIKLKGDPGLPSLPLATQTPGAGSELILIGQGRSRGTATSWSGLDGWNWIYPYTTRWGSNRVTDASVFALDTQSFSLEFDAPGDPAYTTDEAIATQGDSGGGVFHETGGSWVLAGILFAVSQPQNQPSLTSLYTNSSLAADVASYRDEILSIIQVPDCSNGLDDDLDGQIDVGADPGCDSGSDTSEQSALLECDNGLDDDGDGLIDYPLDPECVSSGPASESPQVPVMSGLATWLTLLGLGVLGVRFAAQSNRRTR